MQLFPAIDLRGGKCVRLRQGDYSQETVFGDDPVAMAQRWADEGAEWLHLVDLDGAKAGRPVNHEVIGRITKAVGIPCQVGGGLRDEASIRLLLQDAGVTRVILGTAALKQPQWFAEISAKYPGRLCLGIDAKGSMVATEGWLDVSQTPALELARQFAGLDLGAVIYTNIANDGMMQGIDAGTLHDLGAMADLGLPVIASGGVTTIDDLHRLRAVAADHPYLTGAIIGRALYEGTIALPTALAATRA